jgi:hypothetical protein
MEDTHIPKMTLNTKPEGKREVGRPKLGWLDDVEAHIRTLGIKRWRLKARDRTKWMVIVSEGKVKLKGR